MTIDTGRRNPAVLMKNVKKEGGAKQAYSVTLQVPGRGVHPNPTQRKFNPQQALDPKPPNRHFIYDSASYRSLGAQSGAGTTGSIMSVGSL